MRGEPEQRQEGFGDRLKRLMEQKRMTQRRLANIAGVTEAAVSHYINGGRIPRFLVLKRIAEALDVSVDDLMDTLPKEEDGDEFLRLKRMIARSRITMSDNQKMELARILFEKEE